MKIWIFIKPFAAYWNERLVVVMILIFCGALSACSEIELDVINQVNAEFSGVTRVEVDGMFLDVDYVGDASANTVTVEGIIRATRDGLEITYRQEGEVLYVAIRNVRNPAFGSGRRDGYIRLVGPRQMEVVLETGSGNVTARGVVGREMVLGTAAGSVVAKECDLEKAYFEVSSGKIKGTAISGDVTAEVSSGNIEFHTIDGSINAKSSSGNIRLESVSGQVDAKTTSGNIRMENVFAVGLLQTTSGNIEGKRTGLSTATRLKGTSGNISLQTDSTLDQYNFELSCGSGKVRVGDRQATGALVINNGAQHTIVGEVSSGSIEIY